MDNRDILTFSNSISLNLTLQYKHKRRETQNLHDYVMFATTGAVNEVVDSNTMVEIYWRRVAYIPVIDSIVRNIRFQREFTHGMFC
jgi:hypothetical protein